MNYDACKKCGLFCNLDRHHCAEWDVWLADETREDGGRQYGVDAEHAAETWSERYDQDDHELVGSYHIVCVALPGNNNVKRFRVSAEASVDYTATEVE